ncbi:MAG: hypothetical protein J6K77_06905, partial [Ruminococcus sp.]|nr:hypothetical protein [Ruminococcus sp.]
LLSYHIFRKIARLFLLILISDAVPKNYARMPEYFLRKEALFFYPSISLVLLVERVEHTNFFRKK